MPGFFMAITFNTGVSCHIRPEKYTIGHFVTALLPVTPLALVQATTPGKIAL